MIVELDEFLKLFAKKYPSSFNDGYFPRIVLYDDESGCIERRDEILFDFDNLEELLAHLKDEEPKPSY